MKELLTIQAELKAPKSQKNSFGNYNYRSCEDILEAVKPLCVKHNCVLTISDEMIMLGDRFYVKATATIKNSAGDSVPVTAYARESETKKGMDASQITGSASSYARKYSLNGLFCIDDTKDADTMDNRPTVRNKPIDVYFVTVQQKGKMKDFLKKFTENNDSKAIDYISEALANKLLTKSEAATIIKHAKTKLGEN